MDTLTAIAEDYATRIAGTRYFRTKPYKALGRTQLPLLAKVLAGGEVRSEDWSCSTDLRVLAAVIEEHTGRKLEGYCRKVLVRCRLMGTSMMQTREFYRIAA